MSMEERRVSSVINLISVFLSEKLEGSAVFFILHVFIKCKQTGVTPLSRCRKNSPWSNYLTGVFLKVSH